MRIERLSLLRYGGFTDRVLQLPHAERDIHLIVGANEAGKSTTRRAITELLFGIAHQSPYNWKHRYADMRLGALLQHQGRQLDLVRVKGNKNTLRHPDDSPLPEAELAALLGRTDQAFFERMYALDLDALVQGGHSLLKAADDLGEQLFQSAAGLTQLGDLAADLERQADGLWGPRAKTGRRYHDALGRYEQALAGARAATLRASDWVKTVQARDDAEAAHQQALQRHATLAARATVLQRVRRVRPQLAQLDHLQQQLAAHAGTPELGADARALLDQTLRDVDEADSRSAVARSALAELQHQQAQLPVDHALLDLADEVQALDHHRIQLDGHTDDLVQAQAEINRGWAAAQRLAAELALPGDDEARLRERLPRASARHGLDTLAHEHALLQAAHAQAEAELAALQQQLNSDRQRRQQLPATQLPPGLAAALEAASLLGDVARHTADRQQALRQARAAAAEAAAAAALPGLQDGHALGPDLSRPGEQPGALLPDGAELARQLADEATAGADERAARARLQQAQDQRAQAALALQQFAARHATVGLAQLQQARHRRDQAWARLQAEPARLAIDGAPYQGLVHEADTLADQRFDNAQAEATQTTLQHRLDQTEQALAQAGHAHQQAITRVAQLAQDWLQRLRRAGMPALPASQTGAWLTLRQQALQARDTAAREQAEAQAWTGRLQQAVQQLGHELGDAAAANAMADPAADPAAPEAGPETAATLVRLLHMARQQRDAAARAAVQAEELDHRLAAAGPSLARLQHQCHSAQAALHAWQQAWQQALAQAGLPTGSTPAQATAQLKALQALADELDRLATLREGTLHRRQAERVAFNTRVRALRLRLGVPAAAPGPGADPDPGPTSAALADWVAALHQQLRLSARHRDQQAALQVRQHTVQAQADAARQLHDDALRRVKPLLLRAGVADLAALAPVVDASEQRHALQQQVQAVQAHILADADGLTLDGVRTECCTLDAADAAAEASTLEQQQAQAVAQVSELAAQLRDAQTRVAAATGRADAARAEADRQQALATMTDAVEQYVRLKTAERLLRWAMERYREAQQGPMLTAAARYFVQATCGSFARLQVDFDTDPPVLRGMRADGSAVAVAGMSDGTRDQLFLSLRLAALELQIAAGHPLPLVADDLFVNFDDQRAAAGLAALGELSRHTQVIFLTHHEHLLGPARAVLGPALNVVRL